jgi:hypothetical protein
VERKLRREAKGATTVLFESAWAINHPLWLELGPAGKLLLPSGLLFLYRLIMKKAISRTEKRGRGRPATHPTSIHLTLAPGPLAEVEEWIERQKEPYTRPEAIRRLVEIGLKAKKS